MNDILLDKRDARIWYLRHQCKWSAPRIARHLNLAERTVYYSLRRLSRAHGHAKRRRRPLKQRSTRVISLSQVFNV